MNLTRCSTENLLRDIHLLSKESSLVTLQAELEFLLSEVKRKLHILREEYDVESMSQIIENAIPKGRSEREKTER